MNLLFILYAVAVFVLGQSEIIYMGAKCNKNLKNVRYSELFVLAVLLIVLITDRKRQFTALIAVCFMALLGLFLKELGFWWINIRKFLFFNKVVNPFNTDYLITFDIKNEVLKYFGTLREMDKKRFGKWALDMLVTPIALLAYICFTLIYLALSISGNTSIIQFALLGNMVYLTLFIGSVWYTGLCAAKKFYRKTTKK